MAKLKRILNQIAIHTAGLIVIYAVIKQLGLTASLVLIGALALGYFTAETNGVNEFETKEEAK